MTHANIKTMRRGVWNLIRQHRNGFLNYLGVLVLQLALIEVKL